MLVFCFVVVVVVLLFLSYFLSLKNIQIQNCRTYKQLVTYVCIQAEYLPYVLTINAVH